MSLLPEKYIANISAINSELSWNAYLQFLTVGRLLFTYFTEKEH